MGKCRACQNNECERKYVNSSKCEDSKNCTCTCQEKETHTAVKGWLSGVLGVAAFVGGVALTVSTGGIGAVGIAAVIGGSAISGVGATAAIHPVAKKLSGERITGKEYAKDLAIGTVSGLVTGGIGSAGASVTTAAVKEVGTRFCAQGLVKLTTRSVTGAVAGAASSSIQDIANEGKINSSNFLRSCAVGAVTGGVGHVSGNVVNKVADKGIERALTRVGTDVVGAAAIDCGCQLYESKSIDPRTLAMNVGARAVMSATGESVKNATYLAHGGKEKMIRNIQYKHENVPKAVQGEIEDVVKSYDKISESKINKEMSKVKERHKLLRERKELFERKDKLDIQLKQKKNGRNVTSKQTYNSAKDKSAAMKPIQDEIKILNHQSNKNINQIKQNAEQLANNQVHMMGERNIHALNNRTGQIAADLVDNNTEGRGLRRVVFDINKRSKVTYAGYTDTHDYDDIPLKSEILPLIEERSNVGPFIKYEVQEKKERRQEKND